MSTFRLFLLPLAAALPLVAGCTGSIGDSAQNGGNALVTPEAITAVISRSGSAQKLMLNHQDLTVQWAVTRDQEVGCGGAGIAGGEAGGKGNFSHLGKSSVQVSAAWDIANLLQGPARFKPVGPASGPVAPVLGRNAYPYAFHYDPDTKSCTPGKVATGKVVLVAANGDRLFGDVTGGETHKLRFIVDGDGVESFLTVDVTGGTGRFAGATGSFVFHEIGRMLPSLRFGFVLVEILPGGTIGY